MGAIASKWGEGVEGEQKAKSAATHVLRWGDGDRIWMRQEKEERNLEGRKRAM